MTKRPQLYPWNLYSQELKTLIQILFSLPAQITCMRHFWNDKPFLSIQRFLHSKTHLSIVVYTLPLRQIPSKQLYHNLFPSIIIPGALAQSSLRFSAQFLVQPS